MSRPAIDVSELPPLAFGHRGIVWWATMGVIAIEGTMFVLTLHPHVSGHRSRVVALEQLIAHIESKPKGTVWFATHGTAAEYVRAQAKLGAPVP